MLYSEILPPILLWCHNKGYCLIFSCLLQPIIVFVSAIQVFNWPCRWFSAVVQFRSLLTSKTVVLEWSIQIGIELHVQCTTTLRILESRITANEKTVRNNRNKKDSQIYVKNLNTRKTMGATPVHYNDESMEYKSSFSESLRRLLCLIWKTLGPNYKPTAYK